MRTRNLGVRPVLRGITLAFAAAGLMAAAGCGGGGGDSNGPAITNGVITTNPAPLTHIGGTASVSVNVADPAGVNASSVVVDVKDAAGTSLLGGAQVMNPVVNPAGNFTFDFTVPNNTFGSANKVYTVTVTATDKIGNKPIQPTVVGTVSVPFPPPPPGGP